MAISGESIFDIDLRILLVKDLCPNPSLLERKTECPIDSVGDIQIMECPLFSNSFAIPNLDVRVRSEEISLCVIQRIDGMLSPIRTLESIHLTFHVTRVLQLTWILIHHFVTSQEQYRNLQSTPLLQIFEA